MNKAAFLLAVGIMVHPMCTHAMMCSFNPSDNNIYIKESSSDIINEPLTLTIVDSKTDISSLNDTLLPFEFLQLKSDDVGGFNYSFSPADGFKTGKYNIYINGTVTPSGKIILINNKDLSELYEMISAGKASDEIIDFLSQKNAAPKDYDSTLSDSSVIAGLLQKQISENKLLIGYERIMAQKLMINGNAERAFELFEQSLGIDYINDYTTLSDYVKAELCSLLKKSELPDDYFINEYKKYVCLAKVRKAKSASFTEMKNVITENADKCGIDLSGNGIYQKISDKSNVYAIMMNKQYEKFEDIAAGFVNSCSEQYANEHKTTGTGGGGGGQNKTGIYNNVTVAVKNDEKTLAYNDLLNHWAKDNILNMSEKGYVSGYPDGSFKPDNSVTRAEFVTMLMKTVNTTDEIKNEFSDVFENEWYYKSVMKACTYGIAAGFESRFNPNDKITREDAAVMIFRFLEKNGVVLNKITEFSDSGNISAYAKNSVEALAGGGILNGVNGAFYPKNTTTRAEAVAILERVLSKITEE